MNKMIKNLDVVDAFAPISNNKLNGIVGGEALGKISSLVLKKIL